MKTKRLFLLLPLLGMLFACDASKIVKPGREYGDDGLYALYMYNYPRIESTAPSGNEEKGENLLYVKQEITVGEKLVAPENPTRKNYTFAGWYKEKDCENEWNFDVDVPYSSVLLYAKWSTGGQGGGGYVEPEYVYPETIITDANYRVTGILNKPVTNNYVTLASGAINRLKNSPNDVRFAVNYERKQGVELTVATFNEDQMKIHLEVSSGETFDIQVTDNSAALNISSANATFETKAKNYETKGSTYENYHIMLAGSSSMEYWETSYNDMLPIISYNHGIGGTTVEQWTSKLFERLVLPYSPKAVVYYVGVNDIINNGKDGETTASNLEALFNKTHEYLPNTQIFYVLINKLPGYMQHQEKFDVANNGAIAYSQSHSYLTCIDAGAGLLKENGNPHAAYFRTDGLHMSRYGYVIWGGAIKEAIIDWLG